MRSTIDLRVHKCFAEARLGDPDLMCARQSRSVAFLAHTRQLFECQRWRMQNKNVSRLRSIVYCTALPVLFFLMFPGACHARPKKDIIQFINGDRITCEITSDIRR